MATSSFDEGKLDEREAGEIDQSVEDELLGEPVIQPRAGTSGVTQQASHTPAPRPSPATAGISPLIHQTAQAHIQPPQVLASQTVIPASTVFSQPPPQTVYVQQQPQQPQTVFSQPQTVVSQPAASFVIPQAPTQQAPVQQVQHVPTPQRTANLTVPQTPHTQVLQAHLEQQNFQMMQKMEQRTDQKLDAIVNEMRQGLQTFMQQMQANQQQLQANQQAQAQQQQQQVQMQQAAAAPAPVDPQPEPMEVQAQATAPPRPTIKKGLVGTKGSSNIAASSMQSIVAPQQPSASRVRSPLELLEAQNYGTEQQKSPIQPKEVQETEVTDLPPRPEFGQLLSQIRHFLSIPEPATEEAFKPGATIGRDPNMLKLEQAN